MCYVALKQYIHLISKSHTSQTIHDSICETTLQCICMCYTTPIDAVSNKTASQSIKTFEYLDVTVYSTHSIYLRHNLYLITYSEDKTDYAWYV